jgi:hypothetical protein
MNLGWVLVSSLPASSPSFEIGKNSNSVNPGYPRQSQGGFERVLTGTGFIVMLEAYLE